MLSFDFRPYLCLDSFYVLNSYSKGKVHKKAQSCNGQKSHLSKLFFVPIQRLPYKLVDFVSKIEWVQTKLFAIGKTGDICSGWSNFRKRVQSECIFSAVASILLRRVLGQRRNQWDSLHIFKKYCFVLVPSILAVQQQHESFVWCNNNIILQSQGRQLKAQ